MGKKKFNGVLFGDTDAINEESEFSISPEKINIDPELEFLIPPLSEEELNNLEESILAEGCREPLILWQSDNKYMLVDGHNRYRLCRKHHINFKTSLKNFTDKAEVKDWMLANQMSRRNLSPLQMSYLRGLRYENEKLEIGRQKGAENKTGQNDQFKKMTSKKLSEEYGVGEKTIRRDARFAIGLNKLSEGNQGLRWNILNGKIQAKKNTVSDLADQDTNFLEQVQAKLSETNTLEKAIMLLQDASEDTQSKESDDFTIVKKKLLSLSNKARKLDKKDPKRKETIKELREVFKEFIKALEV